MFKQVHTLPCAKHHPAALDGDCQVRLRQRRTDMRRHVIRTFGGMAV